METPRTIEREEPRTPIQPPEKRETRARRWWLWLLIIAALAAAAYFLRPQKAGVNANNAPPQGARAMRGPTVTPVVSARARKGDIGVYLTGLGAVTPIYTVTLRSRVDGQLMKVSYREGDLVHQGDPLAEIDPRPFQVQLAQAEGQLTKDQAALDNARLDLTRYQTLWTQNAIPEQQLATQKALVTQYEGAVKTDQAAIDNAKLNLVYSHITAPISGRVGLRLVDPGNIVHASDSNGLLVITQIQPISVIFTLAEDQLPVVLEKVRAGNRLSVDAYDRTLSKILASGWLSTIDNQIDQSTGTVKLRATFDNRDNALFPNQFVNARLLVEEKQGVTLVPTATVQRNAQNTYAFIVHPGSTVTVHQITTGTTEGGDTEVTSGISPGDVVVMTGVDKLQEGSRVAVRMYGEQNQNGGQGVRPQRGRPVGAGGKGSEVQ